MEDWLDPCLDAEEMRATDALGDQGPGRSLARADGDRRPGGRRGRRPGRDLEQGGDRLRQGEQRRATGWSPPEPCARRASRSTRCCSRRPTSSPRTPGRTPIARAGPGRWIRASSRPRWRAPGSSSTPSSAPASPGTPRGPRGVGDRRDERGGRPGGGDRHRIRRQRLERRGRGDGRRADVTVTFHAPKLGHWIAPGQGAHRRAAGGPDRHPGGRAGRAQGGTDRPARAGAGAEPGGRVDQVQLRAGGDHRRVARAHRRGLPGGARRRSAPARGTRRWRFPPTWSGSSR